MTSQHSSDEDLMGAYAAGDAGAFRELVRRHSPGIRRFLERRGRDTEEAEKLVTSVFVQLHRARYDFREGASVSVWLRQIAKNLCPGDGPPSEPAALVG